MKLMKGIIWVFSERDEERERRKWSIGNKMTEDVKCAKLMKENILLF